MKRFGLALLFTIVLPLQSQNPEPSQSSFRLLDMQFSNSQGEEGVTTFDYNEDGSIRIALWHLMNGSRSSINFHRYDKNGQFIEKHRQFSDGLTSTNLYFYDEEGRLLKDIFQRSDGLAGKTIYTYNKQGFQQMAICENLNGWFSGEIVYHCDENGKKDSASLVKEKQEVGTIQYTYDEKGNLKSEFWDFGPSYNQTFTYVYETVPSEQPRFFSSSNAFLPVQSDYRLIKENYSFTGMAGGPSFFTYSDSGKLILKSFERSDGVKTETHYLYKANGQLYKSYRMFAAGGSSIYFYETSPSGKLAKRSFIKADGTSGHEFYHYTPSGEMSSAEWNNFDAWLTGILNFSSEDGNLAKGHFKGTGEKPFDADLTFDYDSTGNMKKISWVFSFGKSQVYEFDYEAKTK